jgi:glucose/arabinose dehydrogenase
MRLAKTALLVTLASATAFAQINVGTQKPEASVPFTMTTVSTFELPWRLAFLPDGRMLVTEKVGPVWLVSQQGEKIRPVSNTPPVYWQGQNGMHGVFVSPHYATDQSIYLTYAEPGDYGGGLALARAKLNLTDTSARLENFEVLWRQMPRGKGGQEGAQVAFSPDGESLFLTLASVSASRPPRIRTSPRARSCG